MATQVIMPQLGKSVVEGTVTKWLKQKGETVQEMEALLEVNTDKVETEIPSPASGVLLEILVAEGTTVQAGTVIAWIGEPGETIEADTVTMPRQAETSPNVPQALAVTQPAKPLSAPQEKDLGFISPVVARMAKEHQIDLTQVKGTGQGGRITKKDLSAFLEERQKELAPSEGQPIWETPADGDLFRPTELVFGQAPPISLPPSPSGSGRLIPFSSMRKAIAEHMITSKRAAAHVTTVMEADLSRVVAHRKAHQAQFAQQGAKLTYTAYLAAAAIAALKAFPMVNSSFTAEGILIHPQIHLGIAASLGEEGLIVPVIKHADSLSLLGLARAINDLAQRARSHQLKPDEVRGGTFTLTNHGVSGSLFATPIINQSQCAILGVGRIQKRVIVVGDEFGNDALAIRPLVYLSLTFDHRILDGASADAFLQKVVTELEKFTD